MVKTQSEVQILLSGTKLSYNPSELLITTGEAKLTPEVTASLSCAEPPGAAGTLGQPRFFFPPVAR